MQHAFGAIHNHATNKISIPSDTGHVILTNQIHYKHAVNMLALVGLGLKADIKQRNAYGGVPIKPTYLIRTNKNTVLEQEKESGKLKLSHLSQKPSNQRTPLANLTRPGQIFGRSKPRIKPATQNQVWHSPRSTLTLIDQCSLKKPTHSKRSMLML